jgi:NosR/NirI family transcriptional regulator, nitrous oxide reductase regulator
MASSITAWLKGFLGYNPPEPSYPPLPLLTEEGQAKGVPGLSVIGEVSGVPLLKLGLNSGHQAIDKIAKALGPNAERPTGDVYDVLIVGAGAAGMGASMRAQELGLRYITLEANQLAQTVVSMTKGKLLFAEPNGVPQVSSVWFEECTKEVLLERWRTLVQEKKLNIKEQTKVTNLQRKGGLFEISSDAGDFKAKRVILAIGKAGNPRKAGAKGEREFASKIFHRLEDADLVSGKEICIYGGGDVALEAALALCDKNRVTLVTIDKELVFPKKRNIDALLEKVKAGKVALSMGTTLKEVTATTIAIEGPSGKKELPNDLLFEMIGSEIPLKFLTQAGLTMEKQWTWQRYVLLLSSFSLVYLFYAWKKGFPLNPSRNLYRPAEAMFPWSEIYPALPKDLVINMARPLGFEPSFWYSGLYSLLMLVFGLLAMRRWNSKHQTLRYISLIGFQVIFFVLVNLGAPKVVGENNAWRAWGLYQPWPLFSNTFYWFTKKFEDWGGTEWFFIGFGVFLVVVFMPLMARYQGKRFCTWICGCGGLAETVGDRWRHLAPKGKQSRDPEFQGLIVFAWAFLVLIATFVFYDGNAYNPLWKLYDFIVDFWLVAVIPIALYPLYGGKVWCRYWCPLAAYNQVLSKWFGRLKIVSTPKCITCTLCSRYCQVGVDVMAFAKNQQAFDNSNSACIHCGICIEVCPMDVLSFETSAGTAKKHLVLNKKAY